MKFTIKRLRQAGFKVRVIHSRHYENTTCLNGYVQKLSCKGGSTKLQITTPDKQINVEAVATCSLEDSFDRKLGNSIALGRAIQQLQEYPEIKTLLEQL